MGENFLVVERQSSDAIAPSVSVRRMEFPDSSDEAVGILAPFRRCGLYGHEDDFTKPPGSGWTRRSAESFWALPWSWQRVT